MDFTCNICGRQNTGVEDFGREVQNCAGCFSNVRIRALLYALSRELFGTALQLRDFPVLKGLRSLGLTDEDCYAKRLAEKFDYKNTFFDREPKLDIAAIDVSDEGAFDVVIASEVFEHVRPPFERALENALRLLRPDGILLLTVPYHLDDLESLEHFPHLGDAGLAQLRSGPVLVNRTAEGKLEVFEELVFHLGTDERENDCPIPGSTLEMRALNEAALRRALLAAGFSSLQFYGEDHAPFGIRHMLPCSLPVVARKQPFEFRMPLRTELTQQVRELSEKFRRLEAERVRLEKSERELRALQATWWNGLGRRLRFVR